MQQVSCVPQKLLAGAETVTAACSAAGETGESHGAAGQAVADAFARAAAAGGRGWQRRGSDSTARLREKFEINYKQL